ncbi:hypothetical protein BU16DRAFT_195823 [Lophium mytilinum]|uniref:Uncharacterized protein n=1 Tax=Lophium mytilinum TaxID=390894 RepID=A0A6A6RA97_9PEZI|nr:hypothetical protein BU16DRAFT_195823 [Lophium mytilinum]
MLAASTCTSTSHNRQRKAPLYSSCIAHLYPPIASGHVTARLKKNLFSSASCTYWIQSRAPHAAAAPNPQGTAFTSPLIRHALQLPGLHGGGLAAACEIQRCSQPRCWVLFPVRRRGTRFQGWGRRQCGRGGEDGALVVESRLQLYGRQGTVFAPDSHFLILIRVYFECLI